MIKHPPSIEFENKWNQVIKKERRKKAFIPLQPLNYPSIQAFNSSRRSIYSYWRSQSLWSPLVEDFNIHVHSRFFLFQDISNIGVEDLMQFIWDVLHSILHLFGASILVDSRIRILCKDFNIRKVNSSIYFVYIYCNFNSIFKG